MTKQEVIQITQPLVDIALSEANSYTDNEVSQVSTAALQGEAIPSMNPGSHVPGRWWMTVTSGTYTNFSGIIVSPGELVAILDNGVSYQKIVIPVDVSDLSVLSDALLDFNPTSNPLDTSLYTTSGGNPSAGSYFGRYEEYFNGADKYPVSISIYSVVSATVDICYFNQNGTSATVLKVQTVSVVSGINNFDVDPAGLGLDIDPNKKVQTAITGYTLGGVRYRTGSGFTSFSLNKTTNLLTNNGTIQYCYWITSRKSDYRTRLAKLSRFIDQQPLLLGPITGANLQEYINTLDYIQLPAATITITSDINVPSSKRIEGVMGKTIIQLSGAATTGFVIAANIFDVQISSLQIKGTWASVAPNNSSLLNSVATVKSRNGIGTQKGISISSKAYDCVFDSLKFDSLSHSGIFVKNDGGPTLNPNYYAGSYRASNCVAIRCYSGYYFEDTGSYNRLLNSDARYCQYGIIQYAGNTYVCNGFFNQNRVGMLIGSGQNDSHSSYTNSGINHNLLYNLFIVDTEKGLFYAATQIFGAETYIENTIGISFQGGKFDGVLNLIGGGTNLIQGAYWENNNVTKTGTTNLIVKDCYSILNGNPIIVP